jgi:hypothetical protein
MKAINTAAETIIPKRPDSYKAKKLKLNIWWNKTAEIRKQRQ